jgi:hypothetical protein
MRNNPVRKAIYALKPFYQVSRTTLTQIHNTGMDIFNEVDEETAALIFQLLIEDSEQFIALCIGNGKAREGELPDTQVAFDLLKKDLERMFQALKIAK